MRALRCLVAVSLLLVATAPASAVEERVRRLASSDDWSERWDAAEPLAKDGSPEAVRILVRLLADADPRVRDSAAWECSRVRKPESVAIVAAALARGPVAVRRAVAAGLSRMEHEAALDALAKAAVSASDPALRAQCVAGLEAFAPESRFAEACAAACAAAAKDADPGVRAAAVTAASKIRAYLGRATIRAALADRDEGVRAAALDAVWRVDVPEHLAAAAADPGWRVRVQCAETALRARTREAVDVLVTLCGDPRERVASVAARALRMLSQKDFGRDRDLWAGWWKANRESWKAPDGDPADPRAANGPGTRAQFMGLELEGECTAFVLDVSGSMAEPAPRTAQTRAALVLAELTATLKQLPDGHLVHVVLFSDRIRTFAGAAKPLGARMRTAVAEFVRDQKPDGETNLAGGILTALDDDAVDAVYVLSDGTPTVGDVGSDWRLRDVVRLRNRSRKIAIHVVGIGLTQESDRKFLTDLAAENGGRATFR